VTDLPFQRERPLATARLPMSAAELAGWDEILDARSPSEFAEDHLPGAINCPVLDDAERALVGTAYQERSAFEAKRLGAPLVSANIARIVSTRFADRPRTWRPLVYCWRGGSRSGSLAHVLRQVGWDARQLEGGYKAFRRQVVADLETLPARFGFHVVCGATGSGKSRLIEALARVGAQVLDLEALAAHRGSLLGERPGAPQPTQKAFETALWVALSGLDPSRPVFAEAESRKVGELRVPDALIHRLRESPCVRLEVAMPVRVDLLMEDYAHFVADPAALLAKLGHLAPLHGAGRVASWGAFTGAGDWRGLVADLLATHYDPAYVRSTTRNYRRVAEAPPLTVERADPAAFEALARALAAAADATPEGQSVTLGKN
jgi:tRNA 2-selenouridine synthase